eukprot:Selendium_serpulae@DN2739_c0_g1_i3.p1
MCWWQDVWVVRGGQFNTFQFTYPKSLFERFWPFKNLTETKRHFTKRPTQIKSINNCNCKLKSRQQSQQHIFPNSKASQWLELCSSTPGSPPGSAVPQPGVSEFCCRSRNVFAWRPPPRAMSRRAAPLSAVTPRGSKLVQKRCRASGRQQRAVGRARRLIVHTALSGGGDFAAPHSQSRSRRPSGRRRRRRWTAPRLCGTEGGAARPAARRLENGLTGECRADEKQQLWAWDRIVGQNWLTTRRDGRARVALGVEL